MEWLVLALVGAVAYVWWRARGRSSPPRPVAAPAAGHERASRHSGSTAGAAVAGTGVGLLGAEVLRRATDMNDPNGTFMDGYVAGRLTERAEARDELDALTARHADDELSTAGRRSGDGHEAWEDEAHGAEYAMDEDMSDDW